MAFLGKKSGMISVSCFQKIEVYADSLGFFPHI